MSTTTTVVLGIIILALIVITLVMATRSGRMRRPALKTLVDSFQSKEVADFMEAKFKGAILPAW